MVSISYRMNDNMDMFAANIYYRQYCWCGNAYLA